MDDRRFRIFLAVCDTGNMTRAAEALFMTQPAVSQAIGELEREYGARLFERLNHRLHLTRAGERLRSYAGHILHLAEQARRELADLGEGGLLRVGASLTTGAHLLPGILSAYRQAWPGVDIFSQVDNTSVIERLLLDDRLDVGLVEGPVYSPHLREEKVCDDDLVIACGVGHPFWDTPAVTLEQLAGQAFIARERGSGTRDIFERVMSEAGAPWKMAGVYNNTEAIKQAVRANLALAVLPRIAIEEELARGVLRRVEVESLNLKRQFNLVVHRQKFFTPALEAFMAHARQYAAGPERL